MKDNSVDTVAINNLRNYNKKFRELLECEWERFYINKTKETLNLLGAIHGIVPDKDKVYYASNKIKQCSGWYVVNKKLNSLCMGIKEANDIIDDLDIDNDIIVFLKKVSNEEATLLDINDKIKDWIDNKHLGRKFNITFEKVK